MVIFDWQRGKIPFFVAPPFDDDHPQQSESASDENKDLPKVSQRFNKISVTAEFNPDDLKTSEQKDSDEDEPDWDEVYKSNLPDQDEDDTEAPKAPEPDSEEDIEEDIDPLLKKDLDDWGTDSESEDEKPKKKPKRMATNKQKVGVHYYDEVNTKNKKNWNKKKKGKKQPKYQREPKLRV